MFGAGMGLGKRSYASSIISQEPSSSASVGGGLTFNQSDRLRSRSPSLSSQFDMDYKSQDENGDYDDVKSQYAGTQSGVTVF